MYELVWEERLLIVRSSSFWDDVVMERYERDLRDKLCSAPSTGFAFLVALAGSPPQGAEIVERHGATTPWLMAAGCLAIAMVLDSALLRLQLKRAAGESAPLRAFEREGEARAWLLTQI
ncbi:hypothetical protein [Novosphingobium sp. KN65.2]|uniref:hypothetical protein n=1 Tax=Novosphingobium sp. KN65.2 TaxID=1478134 RepID=UPI0005E9C2BD|nr:hypothetical protein [Novosphingobium sp. KN65.2]CDO38642.1 hypothetical protein SPHV1_670009 [Novosphingobium sp. KN65.2]